MDTEQWTRQRWREENERIDSIIERGKARVGLEHVRTSWGWNKRFTRKLGDAMGTTGRMRFSVPLWPRATEQEREETVLHELAHILVFAQCGVIRQGFGRQRESHGPNWKAMMRALGANPQRCHTVDRTGLKRTQERYVVPCPGCDRKHSISKSLRTKWVRQRQTRRCKCLTSLGPELAAAARRAS